MCCGEKERLTDWAVEENKVTKMGRGEENAERL